MVAKLKVFNWDSIVGSGGEDQWAAMGAVSYTQSKERTYWLTLSFHNPKSTKIASRSRMAVWDYK